MWATIQVVLSSALNPKVLGQLGSDIPEQVKKKKKTIFFKDPAVFEDFQTPPVWTKQQWKTFFLWE